MRDPERDALTRRALIAIKAEQDAADFNEKRKKQTAKVNVKTA